MLPQFKTMYLYSIKSVDFALYVYDHFSEQIQQQYSQNMANSEQYYWCLCDKTGISDTFDVNGEQISDKNLIANHFCSYFTNIGKIYAKIR